MSRLSQEVTARYPFDPEITWETEEQLEILARDAEEELKDYLRKKLLSKPCQNQGFVLDGYPKTLEQAQLLFGRESELFRLFGQMLVDNRNNWNNNR
ncbi:unnamed protein product [Dibothriocephalus latus]|uniref:Uncharacterized protein n=1 Tax=Dibothriocephalus latus TaxID=60516 RepID=A0A3P7PV79_DIBLA|nr:unnamed protein product [Dibothriocephalus latus]